MSESAIKSFYPDLLDGDGVRGALSKALAELGSTVEFAESGPFVRNWWYARAQSDSRFVNIYVGRDAHSFQAEFWNRGSRMAVGGSRDLLAIAKAIDFWLNTLTSTGELSKSFAFITSEDYAAAYDDGYAVEWRWNDYLSSEPEALPTPRLKPYIDAASMRPEIRQLFPYTSHYFFCLSRCTGYPYTNDTPFVLPTDDSKFEVYTNSNDLVGVGTAEEAAEMVVRNLPPNCGPAIIGTSDDLVTRDLSNQHRDADPN